ncbi:MAG: hypothetical protein H6981_00005, partial [Gammaproteobacteria bacterium]|nr:hypothetical protein [Gammaproteobacteria bacterium]
MPSSKRSKSNSNDDKHAETLSIAITFKGRRGIGPTKLAAHISSDSIKDFAPESGEIDAAIEALMRRGFTVSGRGTMTLSVRGTRKQFEETFGTELSTVELPKELGYSQAAVHYPAPGASWEPDPGLSELIDDAYIQWPHIYMAETKKERKRGTKKSRSRGNKNPTLAPTSMSSSVSATPPSRSKPFLDVLRDVPRLLNANALHDSGAKG